MDSLGFANLPHQVHRKSLKRGFEFTLMVVGESGMGKSTLINSLFLTDLYTERVESSLIEKTKQIVTLDASTVEIEERGVKLRLTVVDTPGFGDALDNSESISIEPIVQYIDEQFERFLRDESGLNRRHIVDSRVHCCLYFISPYSPLLKPLDIKFMQKLQHKVNIVPVIAKADTLTDREKAHHKATILRSLQENNIQIYNLPECDGDEDEEYKTSLRELKKAVPFALCGSAGTFEINGLKKRGRLLPWGFVDIENPQHCDFIKLRDTLITHMQDMQEVTHEIHYENFRSRRLALPPASDAERELKARENEVRRLKEELEKLKLQQKQ